MYKVFTEVKSLDSPEPPKMKKPPINGPIIAPKPLKDCAKINSLVTGSFVLPKLLQKDEPPFLKLPYQVLK